MRSLIHVVSLALALALAPLLLATPAQASYERAELEQMLAPIALYPDSVLSHVLIAATYPDEVAEAARWSRRHPDLVGEAAVDAVDDRDWNPSVKALVAFPEVLARMDEDPEWTDELGDAFLDQEGEVMDAVQHLRLRAYEAGRLNSLENVRVVREREYIYIEPAVRTVVFVPYYDPWWVYGDWWWPHYPPYCWRTWHGRPVTYYGGGWYWGIGFHVRPAFYFTTFHWPARYVVVTHRHDRPLYSGRDAPRHQEVRHWRQEPAASRHSDRRPDTDRREDRREDRPSGRRPDRRDPRREDQDRRGNRHAGPSGSTSLSPETRGEAGQDAGPGDARRERMERSRQRRDDVREERPSTRTRIHGAPERSEPGARPGRVEREARSEPPSRRQAAPPERRQDSVHRPDSAVRRDEARGQRQEAPSPRAEAEGQRGDEARGREQPQGARAQGRQQREQDNGGERGRSRREDR